MNGIVELDSAFGKQIGFTSDKFGGYLWRDKPNGRVLISFITSLFPGQGNLSRLFAAIEQQGLIVAVPEPLPRMRQILEAKGFAPTMEDDELFGTVEVWVKGDDAEARIAAYAAAEMEAMKPFLDFIMPQARPLSMGGDEYVSWFKRQWDEFNQQWGNGLPDTPEEEARL